MNGARKLTPIIRVTPEKCVNCRRCVAACPVRFANAARDGHVEVCHDRCIGCGRCLFVCGHGARNGIDDFQEFVNDLAAGVPMVAVVSPAAAANFPDRYLHLNGFLGTMGVAACFDAAFGAELAAQTLMEHLADAGHPRCVIAPACPAAVAYCQLYRPELLPHLAPVHSPVLHTLIMIRRFFLRFSRHRLAVISPCFATKRELQETGLGDYNVTMASLARHMRENGVDLADCPEADYLTPPVDLAAASSSPGGLARVLGRSVPDIGAALRQLAGVAAVCSYLAGLPAVIESGTAPLVLDCLACIKGCNGGPGASLRDLSIDELEFHIDKRIRTARARILRREAGGGFFRRSKTVDAARSIENSVNEFWVPRLYNRTFEDLSANAPPPVMDASARAKAFALLGKSGDGDFFDCTGCGYNSCEAMLQAIHLGVDTPLNCVRYPVDQEYEVL